MNPTKTIYDIAMSLPELLRQKVSEPVETHEDERPIEKWVEPDTSQQVKLVKLDMLTVDKSIDAVVKLEGGYVNHPSDTGGETNYGITVAVANKHKTNLVKLFNWNGKMRDLTIPMARHIYKVDYWDKLKLDQVFELSPIVADKMFEQAVNVGVGRTGKWLQ